MPRGEQRQQNASERASGTISTLIADQVEEEKDEVTPTATVVALPQVELHEEEESKPKRKTPATEVAGEHPTDRKRAPGEDFFDYLQRLTPDDWASGKTAGVYILKENPGGKGNIQLDRIHQAISFDQFTNIIAPKFGPGTYLIQLQTALKHLTACSHRVTYDGSTVNQAGGYSSGPTGGSLTGDLSGFNDAIKQTAEMLKDGAKAAVEVSRVNQLENQKPMDIAGIITAIAALNNHKDGDSAMVKMLEAQKTEADKRADREKAEADKRADRDKAESDARITREITAANERQTRDQQFFQMIMKQNEDRAADKDKFFEILLKEKDKKEAGLGEMMSQFFKAFVADKLEGGGNDTLPGWAGVAQTALPKIADAVSTFMAVRAGASPQQIQQLQAAQTQNADTQHGPNGGMINPAPIAPIVSADQQLVDFINRLGQYVSTHENPDPGYMLGVINEEYGPIEDWIYRTPQDQIVAMLQNNPLGQKLLQIPNAPPFIEALIAGIKNPDSVDEPPRVEPEVIYSGKVDQPPTIVPNLKRKKKAAANQ